jgi:hypothetical protein
VIRRLTPEQERGRAQAIRESITEEDLDELQAEVERDAAAYEAEHGFTDEQVRQARDAIREHARKFGL